MTHSGWLNLVNNSNARKQQIKKYKDDDIAICEPKLKYQHWGLNPGSANFSCEKDSCATTVQKPRGPPVREQTGVAVFKYSFISGHQNLKFI